MLERLKNSWNLVKASARVLQADKELLVFPAVSGLAVLLVTASFILPLFFLGSGLETVGQGAGVLAYVGLFLFYFVLSFVLSSRRQLTILLGGLVVSACFVTLTAAAGIGVQAGGRLGGWGGNVNHLAQNLLVALCAAYAIFVTVR